MTLMRTALVVIGMASIGAALVVVQRSSAHTDRGDEPIRVPERTVPPMPADVSAPPVPAHADALAPVTVTLTTVWERPHQKARRTTQTMMRTSDRVRLVPEDTAIEWLFVRNPIDHTRASGYLIARGSRQIVLHEESALRRRQGLRGWADIVMMRFDPRILGTLRRTDERATLAGAVFVRHVADDRQRPGVVEVWWSDALLLAQKLVVRETDALVTSTITAIQSSVDASALADAQRRFPDFGIVDSSDAGDHRH